MFDTSFLADGDTKIMAFIFLSKSRTISRRNHLIGLKALVEMSS
jgi:hypothetical protein